MSQKIKIACAFLIMIALVSGYFLWQIDRREKALLGQEWLNPVPYMVWQDYLIKKQAYEKLVETHKSNNPELIQLIAEYKKRKRTLLDDFSDKFLDNSRRNSDFPPIDFSLLSSASAALSKENPKQYELYSTILKDLQKHEYTTPIPTNPPVPIIKQSISSHYRFMFMIDGILVLAFITFLVLFKDKSLSEVQ